MFSRVFWGRVRFGAAVLALNISAPDIWVPGLSGTRTFFLRFFFQSLRCFGLLLASLALGLKTLVGTGSHSTAFKGVFPGGFYPDTIYKILWGKVSFHNTI